MVSLRQSIAGFTPAVLRKAVRMSEHYARRQLDWLAVWREMRGADRRSQQILLRSSLRAPISALKQLDGFEPPALIEDVTVDVRGVGRFAIRAGTDDIIHVLTRREPEVRQAIEQRLRPGDAFIDAGANIGFYSVLAARLTGQSGQVVAVEMMPATARALARNLALNQAVNVRIVQNALSDSTGQIIRARVTNQKHGQATIMDHGRAAPSAESVAVQTVTLAGILADLEQVRLMKLDLEGAEFLALKGAGPAIRKIRSIIFENNSRDERIPALLAGHGFAVSRLSGTDFLAEQSIQDTLVPAGSGDGQG